jgi:hypothetical protein
VEGLRPIAVRSLVGPTGTDGDRWPASDIAGVTPTGAAIGIDLADADGPLLLVFLTTGCDGCDQFWDGLRRDDGHGLPTGVTVVAVTRGPGTVEPSEVGVVADGVVDVPVVMSDQAWRDYRVLGYPFFVLVDPVARHVLGETVGFGWSDVAAMVDAALPAER